MIGFFAIAIGGIILVSNISIGGEMPELRRPMAVLRGSVDLDPSARSASFEVGVHVDEGAVDAMHLGDGLVHLELDLETADELEALLVGVRWTSRAEIVRPVQLLALEDDVRWTYACEEVADCERTIGVDIELPDGSAAAHVSWRLVATVRPPRQADVPEVAVVELTLVEGSE